MREPNFPDKPRPGTTKLPTTIENVEHLLQCADIEVRYNLIKKKDEIVIPGHRGTPDNLDNVALTEIVSSATRYGLPHGLVPDCVQALADRNAYNPVANWIRSRPWDGVDRLPDVYATITEQPDYPGPLKCVLMRKWLLSATAAALVDNYKGRGVLTLQGNQSIGKSTWVKRLVTDPKLREDVVKLDHHLDGGNKDSILGAICNWIVEMGELESAFRKDIDRLKGFLTADTDRVRRPYGRRESEYPRRTVFIATVNGTGFLVDPTGNSRWWTIAVDKIDYRHEIDMQQVFAQLAVDLEKGAEWWLTKAEEEQLEAWNSRHRVVSAIAEKLGDFIEHEPGPSTPIIPLTATEVLEAMGYKNPTNAQAKECGAALRELIGESKRIRGATKWWVPLKRPTAESLKPIYQRQTDEEVFE